MEHEMWAEEINTESGRIAKLGRRKKMHKMQTTEGSKVKWFRKG
jgi:hypothetical protein